MDLENKPEECPKHHENFEKTIVNVLDAHGPRKTKVLHSNKNYMLIRIFIKLL